MRREGSNGLDRALCISKEWFQMIDDVSEQSP